MTEISHQETPYENFGYDHPTEFFTRSFSDGIPSWKNNKLRALHTHYQTSDDGYAKPYLPPREFEQSVLTQQSIEALYSKPLKRRDHRENHVHFNDDMGLNERTKMNGSSETPVFHLNGPYTNMLEKNWSKSFLEEIQEKANNIKLRNSLAIENGRLDV